ncbi:MAG: hypothetical protein RLZZ127_1916 [Planctomycetota bacterium]|jgi:ABC-type transport system substrate-binding protein
MERLKIALLAAVALLLVVFLVDRHREAEPMRQLRDGLEAARAGAGQAEAEARKARQEIEALRREWSAAPRAITAAVSADGAAGGDGLPRLGVNFLKPYDRDHFDPAHLRGIHRTFSSTPNGFNPVTKNSAEAGDLAGLANDGLCTSHPASPDRWSQQLATSVVISDDWKVFTFTIRRGVLWQRPPIAKQKEFAWLDRDVELTAHDFVFYVDMVKDPEVESAHLKSYYEKLVKAEAVDDHTLRLTWSEKEYTNIDSSMGMQPLPRHVYGVDRSGQPLPRARLAAAFNQHWFDDLNQFCGVGAYQVAEIQADRRVRFVRNPAYWGAPLHFEELEWDAEVRKPDAQLVAFKNGQVLAHGLTPLQFKAEILDRKEPRFPARNPDDAKAGRAGPFAWETCISRSYNYIGWNMRKPLFADKQVRQALAHAFPKQRIIDDVFMGLGRPQIGPVHPDNPAFDRSLTDFAFDPARARELFAAAGWKDSDGDGVLDRIVDGKRMDFAFNLIIIANSPETESMALVYRNELKAVGVTMQLLPMEWKDLLEKTENRDFDAVSLGWRFGLDIDFQQIWHSKTADEPRSSNHVGFRNAEVDRLSEQLRLTFDTEQRNDIARRIQRIIVEEQPYLFFRCPKTVFIWNKELLGGVEHGLDAYHPLFNRDNRRWFLSR